MNPQIKPITAPHRRDWMIFVLSLLFSRALFSVMTGRMINLMPRSSVMKTEKFPIVVPGSRDAI